MLAYMQQLQVCLSVFLLLFLFLSLCANVIYLKYYYISKQNKYDNTINNLLVLMVC